MLCKSACAAAVCAQQHSNTALPCSPDASMYDVARFQEITLTSASWAATASIDLLCREMEWEGVL